MDYRYVNESIPFGARLKCGLISVLRTFENGGLELLRRLFFRPPAHSPQRIIVFKVGNIGDIICAIPALLAIRRAYPEAQLTLLTSPGRRGALGAPELLTGARYLDELIIYYAEEVASRSQQRLLIERLRRNRYDLFIQLPDDLVGGLTLARNIFFAKLIGARSALGFRVRTLQLWKQTQVDYLRNATEVESLLELLRAYGINNDRVEYDFPITATQQERVIKAWQSRWGERSPAELVIAIGPGGKRDTNRWPIERFAEVARQLAERHRARILIIGGPDDTERAKVIAAALPSERIWDTTGAFTLLETMALLKHCSLLIANSTGTIHCAAAVGLPAVGLYGIRDVPGRWFPYGQQHRVLFRTHLSCNYRDEACIERSLKQIEIESVMAACEELIQKV